MYYVHTKQQTYNAIECLEHLIQVRQNRNDDSPTLEVWEWTNKGYQKIDKDDMDIDFPTETELLDLWGEPING